MSRIPPPLSSVPQFPHSACRPSINPSVALGDGGGMGGVISAHPRCPGMGLPPGVCVYGGGVPVVGDSGQVAVAAAGGDSPRATLPAPRLSQRCPTPYGGVGRGGGTHTEGPRGDKETRDPFGPMGVGNAGPGWSLAVGGVGEVGTRGAPGAAGAMPPRTHHCSAARLRTLWKPGHAPRAPHWLGVPPTDTPPTPIPPLSLAFLLEDPPLGHASLWPSALPGRPDDRRLAIG